MEFIDNEGIKTVATCYPWFSDIINEPESKNNIFVRGSWQGGCCYFNGQWAEIVSKPEEITEQIASVESSIMLIGQSIGSMDLIMGQSNVSAIPVQNMTFEFDDVGPGYKEQYEKKLNKLIDDIKSLDMEKDQRYLDLLDEEAKQIQFAAGEFYKCYNDALKVNHVNDDVVYIEKSAQRKYFELLLSEKDEESKRWKQQYWEEVDTTNILIPRNKELTATIAERDKLVKYNEVGWMATQDLLIKRNDELSEAKATISQQAKEIEDLTCLGLDYRNQIEQLKQELQAKS